MKCTSYDMNAYKLHIIKTDKFKTITVGVAFRRKIVKEEITIRNLLKELMINATESYPDERKLIIATEELYDLKLLASNYRIGNDTILSFRTRFLNEKYTEEGMNKESIKFLIDMIFKPKLDVDFDKCKKKIEKSIISLKDNKIKYSLFKLLETTKDMPYSYNSYGYIDDLEKITIDDIKSYYESLIRDDIVDVYVVGDAVDGEIKNIFREYFKLTTFHKQDISLISKELETTKKVLEFREKDNVNQTQLVMLYGLHNLTDDDRKYILPVYCEMLGGSSNSILFDNVREKNSYAYYVNALVKSYDNIFIIYSGIENGNDKNVIKIINKSFKSIGKGDFSLEKLDGAKETIISSIMASLDNPMGIISNYYAMELVNSLDALDRIERIKKVTKEDIVNVSKKISENRIFILEADNEENNDKEDK